jgi:ferredoxin-like protein FixX
MRADGIFIAVEVSDEAAADVELAAKLTEACPVDIFAQADNGELELVERNLDECVLCGLCLAAAGGWGPGTTVKIIKLYDGEAALAVA